MIPVTAGALAALLLGRSRLLFGAADPDGSKVPLACWIGQGRPLAFVWRFICSMVACALLRSRGHPMASAKSIQRFPATRI